MDSTQRKIFMECEAMNIAGPMGLIEAYHKKLGFPKCTNDVAIKLQQHRDLCIALQAELTELLDSMPWKPWRPDGYKNFDKTNFKEEVVDCIFFLTALCENWNIAPIEIGTMIAEKLQENYDRIERGYNTTE